MKKFFAAVLVVCLAFAGLAGWLSQGRGGLAAAGAAEGQTAGEDDEYSDAATVQGGEEQVILPGGTGQTDPGETGETDQGGAGETDPGETGQAVDYGAIFALHQPKDVVMTVGARDITWDKYFYVYYSQALQTEQYFTAMASYYGLEQTWADMADEDSGKTYAQLLVDTADDALRQLAAIEDYAAENGVELTAENREAIARQLQDDIVAACGEGGTEEEFSEKLLEMYMTRDVYDWMNEVNYIYQQNYVQTYGQNGEKYGEDAAMAWLNDNGYMAANHILFLTKDMATGEELGEADKAEKRASAQRVLDELRAIDDPERLVARFKELKEEFCEDTGKADYPDGYVFAPGAMVAEFEDAVRALEDYGLSDIVESSYGYHVILRLPLDVNAVIDYSSEGEALNALAMASNAEYGSRLQALYDAMKVSCAEGFERPDPTDYLA